MTPTGLTTGLVWLLLSSPAPGEPAAYAFSDADTLRPGPAAASRSAGDTALAERAIVWGFLSLRGLPPRAGQLVVTDSGLVFSAADGGPTQVFLLGWRAHTVQLAYTDPGLGRPIYFFRVDAGVFGTDTPAPLLDLVEHPGGLEGAPRHGRRRERPLVQPGDSAAIGRVTRAIESGSYADSLYRLFGRPARPTGTVGPRGRKAGRLGEYIAARDSLALDPARMTSHDQLRHALAHELGHRWQAKAPAQLELLWRDVAPIRDVRRYGHNNTAEHQAEAIAFAVHFLQATAGAGADADPLRLLDQYELLVPGTRLIVRYLALQPIYAGHPLGRLLTVGPDGASH